jgi:hypothetical protein
MNIDRSLRFLIDVIPKSFYSEYTTNLISFIFLLLEEDEMSGPCSTYGGEEERL